MLSRLTTRLMAAFWRKSALPVLIDKVSTPLRCSLCVRNHLIIHAVNAVALVPLSFSCFAEESSPKKCCTSKLFINQESDPKILIFVSFSMPEASLKALAQEAEKHGAILVMRGLYEDSFVKTVLKLQRITIEINPELFEKHHVTSVPTFIAVKDGQEIHRMAGNVSLGFCAEKFSEVQ